MMARTFFTAAQASGLLEPVGSSSPRKQGRIVLWSLESMLQGIAETQVRTWQGLAGGRGSAWGTSVRRRARGTRSAPVALRAERGEAGEGAGPGHTGGGDGRQMRDQQVVKQWFWLSVLIYLAPSVTLLGVMLAVPVAAFWIVVAWLLAEVLFVGFHSAALRHADQNIVHNECPAPERVEAMLQRFLGLRDQVDFKAFLSGWFLGTPFSALRRDNVREFVAFGFYHRFLSELDASQTAHVDDAYRQVEQVYGVVIPEGHDPSLRFMAHTREQLRAHHRPLALYLWADAVAQLTGLVLRALGFKHHAALGGGLAYWYRRGGVQAREGVEGSNADLTPRIFVHGLGLGVTPYLGFLSLLFEDPRRDAVIVELPHVAMRWRSFFPSTTQLADSLHEMQQQLGIGPACYVAHSFGSMVVAELLHRHPEDIRALGLTDPVCFLLCLPYTIYNFVYRDPDGPIGSTGALVGDCIRWYMVSRELQVAKALCRGFNWHESQVWPDELPAATAVSLAGLDQILPAEFVQRHLAGHGVRVIYNEQHVHAEFLFRPDTQRELISTLEEAMQQPPLASKATRAVEATTSQ